jgi:hypothetical protein
MLQRSFVLPLLVVLALAAPAATAQSLLGSGKLLLTGGLSEVEGAAGGGIVPWAVIGGYGTRDQIGANAFITYVKPQDYALTSFGALVGFYDRVELSYARQSFNTENVGAALGLGQDFKFGVDVFGAKVRLFGDAVKDQDTWMPQVAVGVQYKRNDQGDVLHAIGAASATGTDWYIAATKVLLDHSLLLNVTVRATKANQIGILGFGGDANNSYRAQFEGSIAYLLRRDLAIGGEYRSKPDNLGIAKESDWWDLFVAWAPTKNVALTLAYANLGNIVIKDNQQGVYVSAQVGF